MFYFWQRLRVAASPKEEVAVVDTPEYTRRLDVANGDCQSKERLLLEGDLAKMSTPFAAWMESVMKNKDETTGRRRELGATARSSHLDLEKLGALAMTTTYPGWEVDFKAAQDLFSSDRFGFAFKRSLHCLIQKQRVHEGDRSHPRLVQLDSLMLTYPGCESDIEKVEQDHFNDYTLCYPEKLAMMKKKEAAFTGDRSHPDLATLDALQHTTNYPGWEVDFKAAQDLFSSDCFGFAFKRSLHCLIQKQCAHEGDRSHPRLVELDALVLTYPGCERDIEEVEHDHFNDRGLCYPEKLAMMKKKQLEFDSHRPKIFVEQSQNAAAPPKAEQVKAPAGICCMCLERKCTHVFAPCGHMCSCESCAEESMEQDQRCPLCRQEAAMTVRVYFS